MPPSQAAVLLSREPAAVTAPALQDEVSYEELYRSTISDLKAWIAYRCHHWDMIEECIQQTYITAFRHLDKFDKDASFIAWLKGIAKNEIKKYLHRMQRQMSRHEQLLAAAQLERLEELDSSNDLELSPALQQCLEQLGDHMRTMMWQRYVEEQSVAGMAQQSKRSESAVSVALHRARHALRQCLNKDRS